VDGPRADLLVGAGPFVFAIIRKMIFKKPLLIELLTLTLAVAVLHWLATILFLYWAFWWFDILMHFLGGAFVGALALFVFFSSDILPYPSRHPAVVLSVVLGSVLIVGLAWELWEIFMGLTDVFSQQGDTIIDLVMDFVGGLVIYFYGRRKIFAEK
jgi:hypothetical protein